MNKSKNAIKPILAERIKEQRKLKKITQAQLGEFIGVQDQTIRKYESGRHAIPKTSVTSIAKVLGCCEEYLYGETNCATEEEYKREQAELNELIAGAVEKQNIMREKWDALRAFARLLLNCDIRDTVVAKEHDGVLESMVPAIQITLSNEKRYIFYSRIEAEEFVLGFCKDVDKLLHYHLLEYADTHETQHKNTTANL